jgi:hypothetical protein
VSNTNTTIQLPPSLQPIQPFVTATVDNPMVALLIAYVSKQFIGWFNSKSEKIQASLFFSQQKDRQINTILQTLRETIRCDRVVLGLVVNGEMSIGQNYHVRSLVVTHESLGAGVASITKINKGKIAITALGLENELYTKGTESVKALISDKSIDPNCRRYMDSIDCLQIITFKLTATFKKAEIDIGYLSFQWLNKENIKMMSPDAFNEYLIADGKRDFIYFKNQLITIIMASKQKQKAIGNLIKLR